MIFDSSFREQTGYYGLLHTSPIMRRLKDCGGLLFLAIGNEVGELFGLPWLQDIHSHPNLVEKNPILSELITDDLKYDSKSAFIVSKP